jgi:CarboxypepD_reg-like domain
MNTKLELSKYILLLSAAVVAACGGGGGGSSSSTPSVEKAQVSGVVSDVGQTGLAGVAVQVSGGTTQASSDSRGRFSLSLETGKSHTLKLSKVGFASQFKVVNFPAGSQSAFFDARMIAQEAAQAVSSVENGFAVTGKDGARVTMPANAVVNAAGQSVTGDIQISITPVNITGADISAFPGLFAGIDQAGVRTGLVSFGTAEFLMTQNGQPLQIAPGKTAEIEIPQYATKNLDGSNVALGQKIPMWFLDETTGVWQQEGEGEVVASTGTSGLALRGSVSHFSWHNVDIALLNPAFAQLSCLGVAGQFSVESSCTVSGALVAPGGGGFVASGEIPANGSSDGVAVFPDQNIRLRGCALVVTASNERGVACGATTANIPSGVTQSVDIPLQLENPWSGNVTGNLFGPVTANLKIIETSVTGTARAFNVDWQVNGTINPDDTVTLGFADAGTATVDFTGSVNALRSQITGTWRALSGPSQGASGQFNLAIAE